MEIARVEDTAKVPNHYTHQILQWESYQITNVYPESRTQNSRLLTKRRNVRELSNL